MQNNGKAVSIDMKDFLSSIYIHKMETMSTGWTALDGLDNVGKVISSFRYNVEIACISEPFLLKAIAIMYYVLRHIRSL